jgi:hypothetical protein
LDGSDLLELVVKVNTFGRLRCVGRHVDLVKRKGLEQVSSRTNALLA